MFCGYIQFFKKLNMIKLKSEVNKSEIMRKLKAEANKRYENAYEKEYAIEQFLLGAESLFKKLRIDTVNEQFYCTCSRAKGLDHDEEGMPYCIECQKPVQ